MQFTTFCGMKIDWNIFKFIIQFECIALFDCTKRRRKKWYPLTQISRSSCIQSSIHYTAIRLPTIKTMGTHTSSTHQNWFTRMCDSVVTIVLSYGCDRFLFRFICCYFDCHLYWMRNNCSNWCNLPNAVTATAMLLPHFATELSTPQEKRHRTSIIDDNRIN